MIKCQVQKGINLDIINKEKVGDEGVGPILGAVAEVEVDQDQGAEVQVVATAGVQHRREMEERNDMMIVKRELAEVEAGEEERKVEEGVEEEAEAREMMIIRNKI